MDKKTAAFLDKCLAEAATEIHANASDPEAEKRFQSKLRQIRCRVAAYIGRVESAQAEAARRLRSAAYKG